MPITHFVLRGYVRKWISDLDHEFEKLDVIKALLAPRAGEAETSEGRRAPESTGLRPLRT